MSTVKEENKKKDVFDVLSSLSGIFIAIAGFFATCNYNHNQSQIAEKQADVEIKKSKLDIYDRCIKYIESDKSSERALGYSFLASFGDDSVALKLIALNNDTAGRDVVQYISKTNKSLKGVADSLLRKISGTPSQKISQIINYFETGTTDTSKSESISHDKIEAAQRKAEEIGIKTQLGFAVVLDSYVLAGKMPEPVIAATNKTTNGYPKDGVSEALWLKIYLQEMINFVHHRLPHAVYATNREEFFLEQIAKGNWDLNQ